ncbi:MAG: hypothetical protein ABS942_12775 [Solibacillus sp.]|uniref:hypothetical protein n=1 Tax=unclassified Solibacillus TaxID=2637870 RepID=UPI0031013A72
MNQLTMITETTPVNIEHHTYKRECRYTRGVHIPLADLENILNSMNEDALTYFEFHNIAKEIKQGTLLNGYNGLANIIEKYYQTEKGVEILGLTNGRDFYVKII